MVWGERGDAGREVTLKVMYGGGLIGFLDGRGVEACWMLVKGRPSRPGWPQGLMMALLSSTRYCLDLSWSERWFLLTNQREGLYWPGSGKVNFAALRPVLLCAEAMCCVRDSLVGGRCIPLIPVLVGRRQDIKIIFYTSSLRPAWAT